MRLSYAIASILFVVFFSPLVSHITVPIHAVDQPNAAQFSPQTYVTFMQKPTDSSPSPWLLYPTNTIVWVAGISSEAPLTSQIREYFIDNRTSKPLVDLVNVTINSLLADPQGRVWFTDNSTLVYYDSQHQTVNKTITFPNQGLWYLALDHQGRIWMTVFGSTGKSSVVMFDPSDGLNRTYSVPTSNAYVQGIAVAPAPDNTVWFAEAGARKLGRIACDSCSIEEISPPSSLNVAALSQVAIDNSGNVWFTVHEGDNQFGVFNPQADTWKTFPIGYCLDACVSGLPNAIFVDARNRIWFSEHIAGRVGSYDPSSDVLTEYPVSPDPYPGVWWAMPGPNNLVWFVANRLGEVGYVNATLPVPVNLAGPSGDIVIQKGFYRNIPVTVNFQGPQTLSFAVSPLTQDQQSSTSPAQLYGSGPSSIGPSTSPQTATISVSAAWSATSGARYVALTATWNNVAVSIHVRIMVVEASVPVVALGFSFLILLGCPAFYLRRPRKPKLQVSKRIRR